MRSTLEDGVKRQTDELRLSLNSTHAEIADIRSAQSSASESLLQLRSRLQEQPAAIEKLVREAVGAAALKLGKDLESMGRTAQERCESQLRSLKEESARTGGDLEREIGEWRGQTKRVIGDVAAMGERVRSEIKRLETGTKNVLGMQDEIEKRLAAAGRAQQEELVARFDDIVTKEDIKKLERRTAETERSLKLVKGEIAEKLSAVDKSMLDLAASRTEALQQGIDALKKNVVKLNAKLCVVLKENKDIRTAIAESAQKQAAATTSQNPAPVGTVVDQTAVKEMRQKLESLQRKVREIDSSVAEAARLSKLNTENLGLQIKNLELSRSLLRLEKACPAAPPETGRSVFTDIPLRPKTPNKQHLRVVRTAFGERRASACSNASEAAAAVAAMGDYCKKISETHKTGGQEKENSNRSFTLKMPAPTKEGRNVTVLSTRGVRLAGSSKLYRATSPYATQSPDQFRAPQQSAAASVRSETVANTEPSKELIERLSQKGFQIVDSVLPA